MQFDHVRIVAGHSPELALCYVLNTVFNFKGFLPICENWMKGCQLLI